MDKGERHFNPFLTATPHTATARLIADVQRTLEANATRGRKLSPQEHARWLRTTEAVIANLARAALEGAVLITPLGQKLWTTAERYSRHGVGFQTYRATVKQLDADGLADMRIGVRRGGASTSTPTQAFVSEVAQCGVTAGDFGEVHGAELIVLTNRTRDGRVHVDYRDGPRTRAMRREVETFNSFLATKAVTLRNERTGEREALEPGMLQLRRRFSYVNGDHNGEPWAFGGRFFAGWQSSLRKSERAQLHIDGEPVAEVDGNAMFARLAAARFNTPDLGDSDLYADVTGFETYRAGLKLALVALLFAPSLKRFLVPSKLCCLRQAVSHPP